MLEDFKTSALLELKIPDFLKSKLWRGKLVIEFAVIDILRYFPPELLEHEEDTVDIVSDVLQSASLLKNYGADVFSYRKGNIPLSVYYAMIGSSFIDDNPEAFPNLTEDYHFLRNELKLLKNEPQKISDIRISPQAKLCHKIQLLITSARMLENIRSGKSNISESMIAAHYNQFIQPTKTFLRGEDRLTIDIHNIVKKIDYIINHHDNPLCSYLGKGMSNDLIFDKNYLLERVFPDCSERIGQFFKTAYELIEEKNGGPGYDAFYEFSEKCLHPVRLLLSAAHENDSFVGEKCMAYMFARCAAYAVPETADLGLLFDSQIEEIDALYCSGIANDTFLKPYGLTMENFETISASIAIADLSFSTFKLWGPIVSVIHTVKDIADFHDKLIESDDFLIQDPALREYWYFHRSHAIDCFNTTAIELDIEEYPEFHP